MTQVVSKIELPQDLSEAIKKAAINAIYEASTQVVNNHYPNYLTKKQAAKYLGISPHTLDIWIVDARVPYRRIGNIYRFSREKLDEFMTSNN